LRATLLTSRTPGPIAIIQIDGDIGGAFSLLGIVPPSIGEQRLSDLCGIDRGIVVWWTEDCAQLMPHGGAAVVGALLGEFESRGIPIGDAPDRWPEADDPVSAIALRTCARAASPAAIPRLLAQPSRWSVWDGASPSPVEVERHSVALGRLIEPPSVVAVGRPNIGKSALVNALSGRRVALEVDEPGVTRDHVGVALRFGSGLDAVEVRWIDTPGLDGLEPREELEQAAQTSASSAIRQADCVALCADAGSGFIDTESLPKREDAPILRVGLRCDLGEVPGADVLTSALTGAGLGPLAFRLRSMLFPQESLEWSGPWRFDPSLRPPC